MNIVIVPIEPIESRYSSEWFLHLPKQLAKYCLDNDRADVVVLQIEVPEVPAGVTEGAFLDFAATNIYKSKQLIKLAEMIQDGEIVNGDVILYTDAWNPTVLQLRYILDLLKMDVKIHGAWHAGSYDKTDILGFTIKDKRWSHNTERAMYYAYDVNYFASEYHIELFANVLNIDPSEVLHDKAMQVGWPMEYLKKYLETRGAESKIKKEKIILFPHRLSPDKQPDMFRDLAKELKALLPDYQFLMTHEMNLDKEAYHDLLARSEFVISLSLHEMLGISMYEGMLHGAIPIMPRRLSYKEMYAPEFMYPGKWSRSPELYEEHAADLIEFILNAIENQDSLRELAKDTKHVDTFFSGTAMYKNLLA